MMTIANFLYNYFWIVYLMYFVSIVCLSAAICKCHKRICAAEKEVMIIDIDQAKKFHFMIRFPSETREFMHDFCKFGFNGMFLNDWYPDFKKAAPTIGLELTSHKPKLVDGMWFVRPQTIHLARSFWGDFTLENVQKEISLKIDLLEQNTGKTNDNC